MANSSDSFGQAFGCVMGLFWAVIVVGILCFVFLGGSAYVLTNVTSPCASCGISGKCRACGGTGQGMLWGNCDACAGTRRCKPCGGSGWVSK